MSILCSKCRREVEKIKNTKIDSASQDTHKDRHFAQGNVLARNTFVIKSMDDVQAANTCYDVGAPFTAMLTVSLRFKEVIWIGGTFIRHPKS